ncbi:transposase [Yinghuangia sp. YIM S10712]|uniref:transposase n=1 Tax=Yinghuangia sp. YIM S10712 TaxID=3436930 RepID=UPI003F539917
MEPLLPPARVRPQGGGTANIDDEAVLAAVVYVRTTGCVWRHLAGCQSRARPAVRCR